MGKPAVAIEITVAERRELEDLARRRKTAQGLARRARTVLAAADGLENKAIVEALGVARSASGAAVTPRVGLTGSWTSGVRGRRARSATRRSPRRSG